MPPGPTGSGWVPGTPCRLRSPATRSPLDHGHRLEWRGFCSGVVVFVAAALVALAADDANVVLCVCPASTVRDDVVNFGAVVLSRALVVDPYATH